MLQELRLIYGNSDTRKLSSADISKQAERVESLLYQLKEAGVEFPGRMRDHVAQACQVSASKLARLKTIRDKLIPLNYRELWEDGRLNEQTAYAIARMEPMMQEEIAKTCPKTPPKGDIAERIQQMGMGYYLAREQECSCGDEGCTNGKRFFARDAHAGYAWEVGGCGCCVTCGRVNTCAYACPAGKEQAAKNKRKAAEQKKAKAERQQSLDERTVAVIVDFAERVRKAAGGDVARFDAASRAADKLAAEKTGGAFAWWNRVREAAFLAKQPDVHSVFYYIPTAVQLSEFCRALGCSMDYLMGLTDDITGTQAPATPSAPTWFPAAVAPAEGQHVVYVDQDDYVDDVIYRAGLQLVSLEDSDVRIPWADAVVGWMPFPAPPEAGGVE